jgi:hypothetical protein
MQLPDAEIVEALHQLVTLKLKESYKGKPGRYQQSASIIRQINSCSLKEELC